MKPLNLTVLVPVASLRVTQNQTATYINLHDLACNMPADSQHSQRSAGQTDSIENCNVIQRSVSDGPPWDWLLLSEGVYDGFLQL